MNKKEWIDEVFNQWFRLDVIRNKNLDLKFEILNTYLNKQCHQTYKQRRFPYSFHQFQSDYIYHCYEVMLQYDASEEEWKQMAQEAMDETEATEALSKFIYSRAKWNVLLEHDEKQSKRVRNGDKFTRVYLKPLNFSELVSEDDEVPIDLVMAQDIETEYEESFIQTWFTSRKEDILTQSQLEFLEALQEANHLLLEPGTNKEVEEITNTYRSNIDNKLSRIADRVIKAFKEDYPDLTLEFNNKPRLRSKMLQLEEGERDVEIVNTMGYPVVFKDESVFTVSPVTSYQIKSNGNVHR